MRIAEVLQNLYMHSHPSSFLQFICRLAIPTPQHLIVLRSQSTAWGNKLSANPIFEQENGLRRISLLLGLRKKTGWLAAWLAGLATAFRNEQIEGTLNLPMAGWLAGWAGWAGWLPGWLAWLATAIQNE